MTNGDRRSATKVNYELRLCKQVERRMLLDSFFLMSDAGFPIRDYEYVGMGSIYFVDYAMLHRHCGIDKMRSAEMSSDDFSRAQFNNPFSFIRVENVSIGEMLSKDNGNRTRRIVWLDYDRQVNAPCLADVGTAATTCGSGSILLATFDAEYPKGVESDPDLVDWYKDELSQHFPETTVAEELQPDSIHTLIGKLFIRSVEQSLVGHGLRFLPMYFFRYQDGHAMISLGGMIADESDARRVEMSRLISTVYYRPNWTAEPFVIQPPHFTRKERLYIDAHMPRVDNWSPADFSLPDGDIDRYANIYRFVPSYGELYI